MLWTEVEFAEIVLQNYKIWRLKGVISEKLVDYTNYLAP
jgi:hypothetical protein